MSISLYEINSLDPEIIHALYEIKSLMKSLDPERLSDLCWMECIGRILLLINEQDTSGNFIDRRH